MHRMLCRWCRSEGKHAGWKLTRCGYAGMVEGGWAGGPEMAKFQKVWGSAQDCRGLCGRLENATHKSSFLSKSKYLACLKFHTWLVEVSAGFPTT